MYSFSPLSTVWSLIFYKFLETGPGVESGYKFLHLQRETKKLRVHVAKKSNFLLLPVLGGGAGDWPANSSSTSVSGLKRLLPRVVVGGLLLWKGLEAFPGFGFLT